MKLHMKESFILSFVVLLTTLLVAQTHRIDINGRLFDTDTVTQQLSVNQTDILDNREQWFILVTKDQMDKSHQLWKLLDTKFGYNLGSFIQERTWDLYATIDTALWLQQHEDIEWIGILPPTFKIQEGLLPEAQLHRPPCKPHSDNEHSNNVDGELKSPACYEEEEAPTTRLIVVVAGHKHEDEANAILKTWLQSLINEGIVESEEDVRIESGSDRLVNVYMDDERLLRNVAARLAEEPNVRYIERALKYTPRAKFAKGWTLDGQQNNATISASIQEATLFNLARGLDGANQIIGIVDTGLNVDHCFFFSAAGNDWSTPDVFIENPTLEDITVDTNHLHIMSYVSVDSGVDDLSHGTYIAGIINGEAPVSLTDEYDGFLPEARIQMIDLYEDGDTIMLPTEMSSVFDYTYLIGGRIQVHAWSGINELRIPTSARSSEYNTITGQFDEYVWEHKDFLPIVAAGYGTCLEDFGTTEIGSPAHSRNALVVGAQLNSPEAIQMVRDTGFITEFDTGALSGFEDELEAYLDDIFSLGINSPLGPTVGGRMKPDIFAPGYFIFSANPDDPDTTRSCGSDLDIAAQGNVWVDTANYGSSMATAVVAGLAGMVREYYVEGYLPTGFPVDEDSLANPSAALIKATLIHGAIERETDTLTRLQYSGTPLTTCNSNPEFEDLTSDTEEVIGFGYSRLDTVLSFDFPDESEFGLFLVGHDEENNATLGDPSFTQTGQSHVYEYCVFYTSNDVDSKITLVWTDFSDGSVNGDLVNNLDLSVTYRSAEVLGNGGSSADSANNVEVIRLTGASESERSLDLGITVTATALNSGDVQPYALILTGFISEGNCSTAISPTGEEGDGDDEDEDPWVFLGLGQLEWTLVGGGCVFLCCGCSFFYFCTFYCRHRKNIKQGIPAKYDQGHGHGRSSKGRKKDKKSEISFDESFNGSSKPETVSPKKKAVKKKKKKRRKKKKRSSGDIELGTE